MLDLVWKSGVKLLLSHRLSVINLMVRSHISAEVARIEIGLWLSGRRFLFFFMNLWDLSQARGEIMVNEV